MKLSILGGVKNPKEHKASRTPGKSKGENCQTSPRKKFYLTHPHAHRLDPDGYAEWHRKAKEMNK